MKKYFSAFLIFTLLVCSCEEILLEDDISDKKVALTAPFDNAQFNSTSVTFHWEPVEGASQYQLQIARPNFTNPLEIVVDVIVDTNSSSQQLNIGNYQWRVRAINSGYQTEYTTRSISVLSNEDFQNNVVVLITPQNNLITKVSNQNLSWQNVLGATDYQLQIYNDANVTVVNEQVNTTNYSYNFPDGNYTWRVRASNGSQQTLYASRAILVDKTVPNTPSPTLPANNASLSGNSVSFNWNRTAISGSAEKDSIYVFKNNTLTDLEVKSEANNNTYQDDFEPGTYFWVVKSFDEAGNVSPQSSVFRFTLN